MKLQMMLGAVALIASNCYAQSAVQCERSSDGRFHATLIWQNTLGVQRADGMCNSYAKERGLLKDSESVTSAPAAPAASGAKDAQGKRRKTEGSIDENVRQRAFASVAAPSKSPHEPYGESKKKVFDASNDGYVPLF